MPPLHEETLLSACGPLQRLLLFLFSSNVARTTASGIFPTLQHSKDHEIFAHIFFCILNRSLYVAILTFSIGRKDKLGFCIYRLQIRTFVTLYLVSLLTNTYLQNHTHLFL